MNRLSDYLDLFIRLAWPIVVAVASKRFGADRQGAAVGIGTAVLSVLVLADWVRSGDWSHPALPALVSVLVVGYLGVLLPVEWHGLTRAILLILVGTVAYTVVLYAWLLVTWH